MAHATAEHHRPPDAVIHAKKSEKHTFAGDGALQIRMALNNAYKKDGALD